MTEAATEPPVLRAGRLGLRTGRGWVFREIDLELPAGGLLAITGDPGSGRSMLLLALAGRARPSTGTLTVAGRAKRREIRRRVAVARVTGAVGLEPDLRVADHLAEQRWLTRTAPAFGWAADVLGLHVEGGTLVGDLAPDDAALLAVALAAATRPDVLVLDDVDAGADAGQQRRIFAALTALGEHGTASIAVTRHPEFADGATVVHTNAETATNAATAATEGQEHADARD
jgi:ABC-2 type transport system ATP-binding protein